MPQALETWGILFLSIVAPLWLVFHYGTKHRQAKGLTKEDETMLADLWESAKGMEERIHTLERILDNEAPGWRGRRS